MSNIETILLASNSQKSTFHTGFSLAASVYQKPVTLFLRGDLGAGKTTFVQGLGKGLGLEDAIVSPTYALENRFGETLLHLDLFRIKPNEATKIVESSEDFPGIRVIEWSERLDVGLRTWDMGNFQSPKSKVQSPHIIVSFTEPSPTARTITITFADFTWPSQETIAKWREEYHLPDHIIRHCEVVGLLAKNFAKELVKRGTVARPEALLHAGFLHDLFRFLDFPNPEERMSDPVWQECAKKYSCHHEEACARYLENHDFCDLATIIRPHGLHTMNPLATLATIEQKILFYADKRVIFDRIVTLDERFDDFTRRYGKGTESKQAALWRKQTKELERELFAEDVP